MSVNLTTALQNISGRNPNFVELDASGEPIASRQTGIVLKNGRGDGLCYYSYIISKVVLSFWYPFHGNVQLVRIVLIL
jgi:hypothetical protein